MAKANPERLSKKTYEARVADARADLVHMQVQLKNAPFPVLIVVAGVDASGKGEVVNTLNAWLDPRGVETFAFHEPTDEERERPAMWRFWRCLPPYGRIGIYAGGWHTEALREDPRSPRDLAEFDTALRRIARFEDQLTHKPGYITLGERGAGFAEVARAVLATR
jgi:polyphosphate kinase 2 (PPK2 family)